MARIKRLNHLAVAAMLAATMATPIGCTKVPVTGREQLNIIPQSTILSASEDQYRQFLGENRLSGDTRATAMVERVGVRIKGAVEDYMREHNLSDQLDGYRWEFHLVQNDEANAWCMPGGKVVVYSGILPVTQTEPGLAVVLGHEIAHAVAQHGNERMSQELIANLGGMALSEALAKKPAETQKIWMTAFGAGVEYGALLPFSRQQESEADHLGLIFMAMAGYDPVEALAFWERMAGSSKVGSPPEFLSTHPSDSRRIDDIKKELPEAQSYYRRSGT